MKVYGKYKKELPPTVFFLLFSQYGTDQVKCIWQRIASCLLYERDGKQKSTGDISQQQLHTYHFNWPLHDS